MEVSFKDHTSKARESVSKYDTSGDDILKDNDNDDGDDNDDDDDIDDDDISELGDKFYSRNSLDEYLETLSQEITRDVKNL